MGGGGLLAHLFDTRFDPDPLERRRTVCALAIEGNPHHTLKLKALEARYRAHGARATFLTETAAASEDGVATFYVDETAGGHQHNEWGSSLFSYAGNTKAHAGHTNGVNVAIVDLTALIATTVLDRVMPEEGSARHGQRRGSVIMKLDIEGGETRP
mmetsp:Transcript_26915/g.66630  ORF Transcript_26915/g.66630 Transcript_26915/m.66630 type:complete len:156 (-) Transcript_26915:753-1220(-)